VHGFPLHCESDVSQAICLSPTLSQAGGTYGFRGDCLKATGCATGNPDGVTRLSELPVGIVVELMAEQLPMTEWDIFPFEGDLRVKTLLDPVLPEPARSGEPGGDPCASCRRPDEHHLWADQDWRVVASPEPTPVPFVLLETRRHHDVDDLPPGLLGQLGPMIQRIDSAFMGTGQFGRVHFSRWGDGGSHFHLWFYGRPVGALQLLGTFLPVWNGVLPPMELAAWANVLGRIGAALEAGGGRQHVFRPS